MVKIKESSNKLNPLISRVYISPEHAARFTGLDKLHAASFTGLDKLYRAVKD